jgi:hypothetical protein
MTSSVNRNIREAFCVMLLAKGVHVSKAVTLSLAMCLVMEIHGAWPSPSPSFSFVHSSSTLYLFCSFLLSGLN